MISKGDSDITLLQQEIFLQIKARFTQGIIVTLVKIT